jgi:hypothetical protein
LFKFLWISYPLLVQGDARVITTHFLNSLAYSEVLFCLAALCAITLKKQWSEYWSLGAFLATRFLSDVILIPLFNLSHQTVNGHSTASAHSAYVAYFYVYWISFAIESILALIVVYSIFRLAMAPLKGLQQLGMLVFRWAAAISIIVALGSAFAPDMTRSKVPHRCHLPVDSVLRASSPSAFWSSSALPSVLWDSTMAAESLASASASE